MINPVLAKVILFLLFIICLGGYMQKYIDFVNKVCDEFNLKSPFEKAKNK